MFFSFDCFNFSPHFAKRFSILINSLFPELKSPIELPIAARAAAAEIAAAAESAESAAVR